MIEIDKHIILENAILDNTKTIEIKEIKFIKWKDISGIIKYSILSTTTNTTSPVTFEFIFDNNTEANKVYYGLVYNKVKLQNYVENIENPIMRKVFKKHFC